MTLTNHIENAKEYLLENKDELRQIVSELNSWNGALDHLSVEENDEYFFETHFEGRPHEAVRAAHFGEFNYNDEYIRFNGYGNLETLSEYDYEKELEESVDEVLTELIENRVNVDVPHELEDILDEMEEDEEDEE